VRGMAVCDGRRFRMIVRSDGDCVLSLSLDDRQQLRKLTAWHRA